MKKILKKVFAITLIITLTLTLSGNMTSFAASKEIKVQYNGENIVFTDAVPKVVDGRTVVPFRQILEAMGSKVSYDKKTKVITAKTEDRELSFKVGGTDLTINENGEKEVQKMDVSPFVDKSSNRTYVPVRFIAESMGYSVGWDNAEKTAIIINPASILGDIDKDFSIIGKLLQSDLDLQKSYESKGKFDVNVVSTSTEELPTPGLDISVKGEMEGIQNNLDADMNIKLSINADNMLKDLSAEDKFIVLALIENFKNIDMKVKMDGDTGSTYIQSGLFSKLDPTVEENTWFKMNIYDQYEDMGIDLKEMMNLNSQKISLSDVFEMMSYMEISDVSTYQDIKNTYDLFKSIIGDEAFTKKTSSSINTYTLDINYTKIMAALAKTALTNGISKDSLDMGEAKDFLESGDFNINLEIKEKNDKLYNYTLKGAGKIEDTGSIKINITGDQKNAVMDMNFDMKDAMKIELKMESHISETNKTPNVELPKDAKVIEMESTFEEPALL